MAWVCANKVSAQQWHPANKKLKQPPNTSGYYTTIGYFNRYDTIKCVYAKGGLEKLGYKAVVVHNGHYADDRRTFRVFFDQHKVRVNKVDSFYFYK